MGTCYKHRQLSLMLYNDLDGWDAVPIPWKGGPTSLGREVQEGGVVCIQIADLFHCLTGTNAKANHTNQKQPYPPFLFLTKKNYCYLILGNSEIRHMEAKEGVGR